MAIDKIPYAMVNGQKVAVFKDPRAKPYGGFVNTTKANEYPVVQNGMTIHGEALSFRWPSSEHAYHAQKLLHLKQSLPANDPRQNVLTRTLRQIESSKANPGDEFLPRDDFDPIVKAMIKNNPTLDFGGDKAGFDKMVGYQNYDHFMQEVVKLKLQQNKELQEAAMQMARDGIIPIEYSRHDSKWASGVDGQGKNMLGILILEEGNRLLKQAGETPAVPDPRQAYINMQQRGVAALSHDTLHGHSHDMKIKPVVANSSPLVARESTPVVAQPVSRVAVLQQTFTPTEPASLDAKVLTSLAQHGHHAYRLNVGTDDMVPGQHVVKLYFNNPQDAAAFSKFAGGAPIGGVNGCCVIMGPERSQRVFDNIEHDVRRSVLFSELVHQYRKTHHPSTVNPHRMPVPHHSQAPRSHKSVAQVALSADLSRAEQKIFGSMLSGIQKADCSNAAKDALSKIVKEYHDQVVEAKGSRDGLSDLADERAHQRIEQVNGLDQKTKEAMHQLVADVKKEALSSHHKVRYGH